MIKKDKIFKKYSYGYFVGLLSGSAYIIQFTPPLEKPKEWRNATGRIIHSRINNNLTYSVDPGFRTHFDGRSFTPYKTLEDLLAEKFIDLL